MAYQPPIDSFDLLPPPTDDDLIGLSYLASMVVLAHAGKIATAAGGIFKVPEVDPGGDEFCSTTIPTLDGQHETDIVVVGYLSEDKVMESVCVMEGDFHWWDGQDEDEDEAEAAETEAAETEDDGPGEPGDVAVINLLVNRRWSAHEFLKNGLFAFYEAFEVLAHEIAHILDRETTLAKPDYAGAKGKLSDHKYEHNQGEMRARVWAALALYGHIYVQAVMHDRWEGLLVTPRADDSDEAWDKFVSVGPLGDLAIGEFNDENRGIFITMLRTYACELVADETRAGQIPVAYSTLGEAAEKKLVPACRLTPNDDGFDRALDEAARALAEWCRTKWMEGEK